MKRPLKHYALALYEAVHDPRATLAQVAKNFVQLLERDGVIAKYDAILRLFSQTWDIQKKSAPVSVISARSLSPAQQKSLEAHVQSLTQGGAVQARYTVDPHLLGGAVVSVGDTCIDGSVRRQLATLKKRITT